MEVHNITSTSTSTSRLIKSRFRIRLGLVCFADVYYGFIIILIIVSYRIVSVLRYNKTSSSSSLYSPIVLEWIGPVNYNRPGAQSLAQWYMGF